MQLAAIHPAWEPLAKFLRRLDNEDGGWASDLALYLWPGTPHRDFLRLLYFGAKEPNILKAGPDQARFPILL